MVRPLRDKEGDRTTEENLPDKVSSQVREIPCEEGHCQIGLKRKQEEDPVFGDIVRLRRSRDEVPSQEELSKESDVTKKLCLQWDRLEVVDEVVYRRLPGSKMGEEDHLQLLVPKSDVEEVLRLCHAGKVGGHFGVTKTQDQVKRRFYWPSWKEDTARFCQKCEECLTIIGGSRRSTDH